MQQQGPLFVGSTLRQLFKNCLHGFAGIKMIFAVAICECEFLISFQIHSRISSSGTPERSRMTSVVLPGLMDLELTNLRLSCAGSFLPHLH